MKRTTSSGARRRHSGFPSDGSDAGASVSARQYAPLCQHSCPFAKPRPRVNGGRYVRSSVRRNIGQCANVHTWRKASFAQSATRCA